MKKALLLALIWTIAPNVIQSQTIVQDIKPPLILQPSQVDSVYIGLQENKQLKKDKTNLQKSVNELYEIVEKQRDSLREILADFKRLDSQIADKNETYTAQAVEIQRLKDKKPFPLALGPGIIYDGRRGYFGGALIWDLTSIFK